LPACLSISAVLPPLCLAEFFVGVRPC